jgi:hypothetical protein
MVLPGACTESVSTPAGPTLTAGALVCGKLTEVRPWLSVAHGVSCLFATSGSTVSAFNSVTRATLARQLNGGTGLAAA